MATYDQWRKGFCIDGKMDVTITANEIFQRSGSRSKKILTQTLCSACDKCIHYNCCKYSTGCTTQEVLEPTIIQQ